MDIKNKILCVAERVFDQEGFNATGMGRLIRETGLSSRTVYKHVRSKNALMALVLKERQQRFFKSMDFSTLETLFDALHAWSAKDGMRGCLYFRVGAETSGNIPEIHTAVEAYHIQLVKALTDLIHREAGQPDELMTEQLLVLFEGAVTASTYRGATAIEAARLSARRLLQPEAEL
ncbi:TetR/AcrR family transcriptional regulator [Salinimonas sediminis]|uniref:TetR/AcrR family transcriptional regulator n=1 Tax=Salinimonas sediminis TaxID=2303538 RepID=A0A346NQ16_9ALTE|nr:TetR/AcrR family transcriptional regulator [Salinimonas sediminis]AXR07623.1 TetR/AcrR family transcriptional regulator [Salinimonas sediminis]